MYKITRHASRSNIITYTIDEDFTDGSFGDYLLLKQKLRELDDSRANFGSNPKHSAKFEQLMFNTEFLKKRLAEFGELHCEYCGKSGLVIYHWTERPDKDKMATCDHIIPKSLNANLAKDGLNCAVACNSCNQKKKSRIWDIKFPYMKQILNNVTNNINYSQRGHIER